MNDLQIPKAFLTLLCIPDGPLEGTLVKPCMCGYPMDLEEDEYYVARFPDGSKMAVHPPCVRQPLGDDDE